MLGASIALLSAGLTAFFVQEPKTLTSAQLFQQVLQITSSQYVNNVPADSLYLQAARGFVKELNDPYSVLLTPNEMDQFKRQMGGEYAGIGTGIGTADGYVVIVRVFPNTPASKAGILEGDKIVGIDTLDVKNWDSQRVSDNLRGPAGTPVRVRVRREGITDPIEITIVREIVHLPAVPYATILDGEVGYIPLQQFGSAAAEEVGMAIGRVTSQGAKKVILDLRGNGGGLTDQAVKISNFFLEPGKSIVSMKNKDGRGSTQITRDEAQYPDIPLVVLVNGTSASASEIVAGALQDHDRAVVIGSSTFGKGSAQGLFNLEGGYALKLTTQRWYTPLGRSIQKDRVLGPNGTLIELHPDSLESDSARMARPRFTTDGGRTILGGGGITPDLVIEGSDLTEGEKNLLEIIRPKSGLFNSELNGFALEHRGKVNMDFVVTEAMRDTFLNRLKEKGLPLDKKALDASDAYIDRLLGQRISSLSFGDSLTRHKYLNEDAQLLKAVSMLKVASTQQALFSLTEEEKRHQPVAVQQ